MLGSFHANITKRRKGLPQAHTDTKTIPEGRPPTHYAENQMRQSLLAVHHNSNLTDTRKLP